MLDEKASWLENAVDHTGGWSCRMAEEPKRLCRQPAPRRQDRSPKTCYSPQLCGRTRVTSLTQAIGGSKSAGERGTVALRLPNRGQKLTSAQCYRQGGSYAVGSSKRAHLLISENQGASHAVANMMVARYRHRGLGLRRRGRIRRGGRAKSFAVQVMLERPGHNNASATVSHSIRLCALGESGYLCARDGAQAFPLH